MGKAAQFICYLLLGVFLFGTLSVVGVISGEDVKIAWISGTIAFAIWVIGVTIWLATHNPVRNKSKDSGSKEQAV